MNESNLYLILTAGSISAVLNFVLNYAKNVRDKKNKIIDDEIELFEKFKDNLLNFISSIDFLFEHAIHSYSVAEEIEYGSKYDEILKIDVHYFKKKCIIPIELFQDIYNKYNWLRVNFSIIGDESGVKIVDDILEIVNKMKLNDDVIFQRVPILDIKKVGDNFFERFIYRFIYKIMYPIDEKIIKNNIFDKKNEWNRECKFLLTKLKRIFTKIDKAIYKKKNYIGIIERASSLSIYVFLIILFSETIIYLLEYLPRLISTIRSFVYSFRFPT